MIYCVKCNTSFVKKLGPIHINGFLDENVLRFFFVKHAAGVVVIQFVTSWLL